MGCTLLSEWGAHARCDRWFPGLAPLHRVWKRTGDLTLERNTIAEVVADGKERLHRLCVGRERYHAKVQDEQQDGPAGPEAHRSIG
jgi:hypothetical protein